MSTFELKKSISGYSQSKLFLVDVLLFICIYFAFRVSADDTSRLASYENLFPPSDLWKARGFQPNQSSEQSISQKQTLETLTEALVVRDASTTLSVQSTSAIRNDGDNVNDGLCNLSTVSRRSLIATSSKSEVTERALTCSKINEHNYHHMVKSIYKKRNKLNIQQMEITESESLVVFSAIDLICERFDCSSLAVFNITGQRIHDSSVLNSWIASWPQIEILDLSNTSLTSLDSILTSNAKSTVTLNNLTVLIIDNNNITELNFNFILERMPNLKFLSLENNSIFNIICNENFRSRVRSQFDCVRLAGNAINCDKNQLWLMKQFQSTLTNFKFPEHELIKCSAPERLTEMTWSQRVSVLETRICDYCDCKSLKRSAIFVDCHNKNLTTLPDILPFNTKILNLTNNRINSLGIPYNAKNWENVTYVYLENNLITSFQPLARKSSKFMRNLAALDIRRNKFQEFPSHVFEQFINLDQVYLSNNPWLCDCEATFVFQEWLQRQFHKVADKEEIMCGISGSEENGVRSYSLQQRLSSKVIYRLSKSELCPQNDLEDSYDWLDVVNLLLGMTILLVLSKVVLDYIYQYRTKRLPRFFRLNFY